MNEDCFGEYPTNECDKQACIEFCEDSKECKGET